jgi:IMP and pyridine-specific 5'-nucleotidase
MSHNTKIGIVTAAGYIEAERYYERLHGLLEAVRTSTMLTLEQKQNLIVMGETSQDHKTAGANANRWRI